MIEHFKRVLRHFGIEAHRYTVQTSPGAQLFRLVKRYGIDLVFDVGANTGQYATHIRTHGYSGRIVSFEPLSSAYAGLVTSACGDRQWQVAPRMALGDAEGKINIHIAGNSMSSSILDVLPAHERAAPGSEFVGSETVPLRRLDHVAEEYLEGSRGVLLKIDTQGYEDRVLAGAKGVLDGIRAIQTELSLVPLYADQMLFEDMCRKIEAMGFELIAIFPGYIDELTGQTLQVDGFFASRNR